MDGGEIINDPQSIAYHFGKYYSSINSDSNFSEIFLLHKVETEFSQIYFPPTNGEDYNNLFTLEELNSALKTCKDTSPGEDGIHYLMLKNLSSDQLQHLLAFFNYLWSTDTFPDDWKTA